MIQLSLFPARGFSLLGAFGDLLVDYRTGAPVFRKTLRAICRMRGAAPSWMAPAIVRVEVHPAVVGDDESERPTFLLVDGWDRDEKKYPLF